MEKKKKIQRPFIKEMSIGQESEHKVRKKRSAQGRSRFLIGIISSVIIGFFTWKNISNHALIQDLNGELSSAQSSLKIHQDYQEDLKENVALLENDEYVANIARSEYYMSYDDEIVFNFVGDPDNFSQDMNKKQEAYESEKSSAESQKDNTDSQN